MLQPSIDLALALRRATAGVHADVERLPLMSRLTSDSVSLEDYRHYLQAILSIHAPLEQALYDSLDAETIQALGIQRKLPALLADLDEQGLPGSAHRTAFIPSPIFSANPSATVGGLYVLEGATLGGRTIARHLRRRLGEPLGSTRFLDFHGHQTATAWRGFTSALNALAAQGVLSPDAVIAGALTVFTHVYARIERASGV